MIAGGFDWEARPADGSRAGSLLLWAPFVHIDESLRVLIASEGQLMPLTVQELTRFSGRRIDPLARVSLALAGGPCPEILHSAGLLDNSGEDRLHLLRHPLPSLLEPLAVGYS